MKTMLRTGLVGVSVLLVSLLASAKFSKAGSDSLTKFRVGLTVGPEIEGKTTELNVTEQDDKVLIVVPLANLDTGIGLRNKHMREKSLEVQKFPTAELTVPRSALRLPEGSGEGSGATPATLKLHGVSKPVNVTYKVRKEGTMYEVDGTTRIKLSDVGFEVPSYLGVTVKQDVSIQVHFKANDS